SRGSPSRRLGTCHSSTRMQAWLLLLELPSPLTIPPKGSGDQRVLRAGLLGLDALHHCEVRGLKHPCFHSEGAGESTLFPESRNSFPPLLPDADPDRIHGWTSIRRPPVVHPGGRELAPLTAPAHLPKILVPGGGIEPP